ncbi:MAG: protein kinase domain-containing protein [Chthoniobacterales bacterium]
MPPVLDLPDESPEAVQEPETCPACGTVVRLRNGACVRCLLEEGTRSGDEISAEDWLADFPEDDLPGRQWRLGNYEILSEIGRGGMGVIYRARQRHSGRMVAVKRMLGFRADTREWMERFRREAQAAASLDHPNILPIYEVSQGEDGIPYFSMKLARGGSLRDARPDLATDSERCVRLMAKVARAVEYAHQQGILHRDLQPGNILLDASGEPLVCDFGLAKWFNQSSDLTCTLTTLGTPGFIAPEQAEGAGADLHPTADVYSLGAILFNLLAERPPFLGSNALSVIRQASTTDAPKLTELVPQVDRDLENITAHCLERDPAARYQSAGALAADLENWLLDRPVSARSVSPPARAWRWMRREPWLAASVTCCVLLALAVAWFFLRPSAGVLPGPTFEKSIAVLPFENMSPGAENASFADGIQDDILTALAKVADLKVISRTSVMGYTSTPRQNLPEIGRSLRVGHVLEGSVRRAGSRVRVSAQLIDTRTDTHLWAETYDGSLSDVFAIQSEIAREIAVALQAKLSPKEKSALAGAPTTDLKAYELYSHARNLRLTAAIGALFKDRVEHCVSLLDEAVARDPKFLLAWCALAEAHDILYFAGYDHSPAQFAAAEKAVQTALRVDPESGAAHLARGGHLYHGFRDYDGARMELETARGLLPNSAEVFALKGFIDRRQGRWAESTRSLERAIELDPRNWFTFGQIATNYLYLRRYPEAAAILDRSIAIVPKDALSRIMIGWVDSEQRADLRRLRETMKAILAEDPTEGPNVAGDRLFMALSMRDAAEADRALADLGDDGGLTLGHMFFGHDFGAGLAARMRGDAEGARIAFTKAREKQAAVVATEPDHAPALGVLAMIDAALGRKEDAMREGRRAMEMLPLEKDALAGSDLTIGFAIICGLVGEKDLAFQYLEIAVQHPSLASYGQLKLEPWWDPLRDDPRFDQIVARLAPKNDSK